MTVKMTNRADENTMTIGELWETLYEFAKNRHEDNKLYEGAYPINTRINQMQTLRTIVDAINDFHSKFEHKKD